MRKVVSALLIGMLAAASSTAMAQDRGGQDRGQRDRGGPRGERSPGGPPPQASQPRPDGGGRDRGPQVRNERRDGAGFGGRIDNQNREGQRVEIQRDGRPDGSRWNGGDRRPDGPPPRIDNQRRDDPRWRDGNRFNGRPGSGANWNNGWRGDRRYDWQGYRDRNRNAFRQPRYVAPYNYGYRRFAPGLRLEPFFFSQRYWIGDPFAYRLPPAYEPYRWIRYYDDVLLVDLRTGDVVDVIPDFFW